MEEKIRKAKDDTPPLVLDKFGNGSEIILEWDCMSMTADMFRKRFKESIQTPLKHLLIEFEKNPGVQMTQSLHYSIAGLVHGLGKYYQFVFSRADHQLTLGARKNLGSPPQKAMVIYFQNIRDICEFVVDTIRSDKTAACNRRPMNLKEIDSFPPEEAFLSKRLTLCRAEPNISFPMLLCWRISELCPINCPDTFVDPQIIELLSEEALSNGSRIPQDRKGKLLEALQADGLFEYTSKTCLICEKTGVVQRFHTCKRCDVAKYCGKEHQVEHWTVHKKHCKKIKALKKAISNQYSDQLK